MLIISTGQKNGNESYDQHADHVSIFTVQKQLCMIFSVVMKIIASLLSQGSFLQISQRFTEKLLMALIQYQKLFKQNWFQYEL